MQQFLNSEGISWHFISPRAPHFDVLWERLLKSGKFHLKRIVANATLTYEEILMLLKQIEAVTLIGKF